MNFHHTILQAQKCQTGQPLTVGYLSQKERKEYSFLDVVTLMALGMSRAVFSLVIFWTWDKGILIWYDKQPQRHQDWSVQCPGMPHFPSEPIKLTSTTPTHAI